MNFSKLKDTLDAIVEKCAGTCTVDSLKDRCVTFVSNDRYLVKLIKQLKEEDIEVVALVRENMAGIINSMVGPVRSRINPLYVDDPAKWFVYLHNQLNVSTPPKENEIAETATIHPTAIVGVEGMRQVFEKGMCYPLTIKHIGNVVIGEYSEVGPFSTIHRATMDSTIIGDYNFIGSYVNIGHNVRTGDFCAFTPQVCIGGSSRIGNNVVIGMRAVVRDGVRICSDVRIGMGAAVVKDIESSGIYFGTPAEKKGEWDGKW
jgi:UDP-3-O-[3-hydroxymyristoyl] glucosamine N-acyltransferase